MAETQSDFAAADDMAPIPIMPNPDVPAIEEDQVTDDVETTKEAQPFWHPAWETVQKKFETNIATYSANNALAYKDLDAFDFKVRVTSEAAIAEILTGIMEDVKRAVESVEQQPARPKPAKRPVRGA